MTFKFHLQDGQPSSLTLTTGPSPEGEEGCQSRWRPDPCSDRLPQGPWRCSIPDDKQTLLPIRKRGQEGREKEGGAWSGGARAAGHDGQRLTLDRSSAAASRHDVMSVLASRPISRTRMHLTRDFRGRHRATGHPYVQRARGVTPPRAAVCLGGAARKTLRRVSEASPLRDNAAQAGLGLWQ